MINPDQKKIQENYLTEKKYIDFINYVRNNQSQESERSITLDYLADGDERRHYEYLWFNVETNTEDKTTKISWRANMFENLLKLNTDNFWLPEFRKMFK